MRCLLLACVLSLTSCSGLIDKAAGLDLPTDNVLEVTDIVRASLLAGDIDQDGNIKGLNEWGAFVTSLFRGIREAVAAKEEG